MAQIQTKFIANLAVTAAKLSSGAATSTQAAFANGSGGTTYRSIVSGDLPSLSGTYLALTGGTMSGAINMGGNQINNMANPTSAQDAATKAYVDAAISGLTWQGPAQAYANSNVPLTGGATLTIDGYAVQNGNLVILGNQTTASQNGEYTVSGIGSSYVLTSNGQPTALGDAWLITHGTMYANSAFVATGIFPSATFVEFAGPTAYTFSAPLVLTGSTVSITQATTSTSGYLSSTDWNTFNGKQAAGNYITALTGDITASGPGSAAATLATVNSNVGTFGSSTSIPTFTVNAKGLITAASGNAVIAPAGTLTGTTLASNVVTSSLTSVGTISSGTWNGTTIAIANGGTGQTTAAAAFNALSPITTTGDLIIGTGTNTAGRLGIGTSGYVLTSNGTTATWSAASASGVTTIGTYNSQTSSANGLVISGTTLYAQAATASNPGMVTVASSGGIALSGSAISVNVDDTTTKLKSNTVEALQPAEQQFTLSSTDITNQYVDLSFVAFGSSASNNSLGVYVVGGPEQQKTVDYTVSLTGGAGGVTRVSFAGGLATGGNSALVAGDILVVDYSYLA
jgi:hypothetical protein